MLSKELIEEYNKIRTKTDKKILCHAPFTNLNFEQNGNITACCYNRVHVLGTYPQNTILEAWTGAKAEELRQYVLDNSLEGGCLSCKELLVSKNFHGAKSLYYDMYAVPQGIKEKLASLFLPANKHKLPKVIELEISNTCNLECEMCNGYFSSAIRKNRENKPALENPYNDAFIEQLVEFIPHLTEMKFLGGEPFMIDIYLKIWERIIEIKPSLKVHITTNGTFYNSRINALLEKLNCAITISLDSLEPDNYARIREGAKLSRVLENIEKFVAVTKHRENGFSIAICPMTINWHELPNLVKFANDRNIHTHYNTVWYPEYLSLKSLNTKELRAVILFLRNAIPAMARETKIQRLNIEKYSEVIKTIEHWLAESLKYFTDVFAININEQLLLASLPELNPARTIVLMVLKYQFNVAGYDWYPAIEKIIEQELNEKDDYYLSLHLSLTELAKRYTEKEFVLAHQVALRSLQKIFFKEINTSLFEEKINLFTSLFERDDSIVSAAYKNALSGNPLKQIPVINEMSFESMTAKILE